MKVNFGSNDPIFHAVSVKNTNPIQNCVFKLKSNNSPLWCVIEVARVFCSYVRAFIVWRSFFTLCSSTRPRARTLGVGKPPDSKACVFSLEAKREEKGATLVEVGSLLVPSRLAESYKLFIRLEIVENELRNSSHFQSKYCTYPPYYG